MHYILDYYCMEKCLNTGVIVSNLMEEMVTLTSNHQSTATETQIKASQRCMKPTILTDMALVEYVFV